MRKVLKFLFILMAVVLIVSLKPQPILSHPWRPVRGGITFGISGMALLSQHHDSNSFLIVHDNKQDNQGRLAIITIQDEKPPQYSPVSWPKSTPLPIDLESITTIPGTSEPIFMAATSAGMIYQFRWDASHQTISILKVFELPNIPRKSNFEGFAVQELNNQLLAVWAHRGQYDDPAILYWGRFDPKTNRITQVNSTQFQVPFPISSTRHISDLKVDSAGVLFISSATDNGDDGPFESVVYIAGALGTQGQRITFTPNSQLVPLYHFQYHKIEALELVPGQNGGVIVGSDDENMGGSVLWMGKV